MAAHPSGLLSLYQCLVFARESNRQRGLHFAGRIWAAWPLRESSWPSPAGSYVCCDFLTWLQKADVDINAKVSMILGDCVLLGESGLDADVWKPGDEKALQT